MNQRLSFIAVIFWLPLSILIYRITEKIFTFEMINFTTKCLIRKLCYGWFLRNEIFGFVKRAVSFYSLLKNINKYIWYLLRWIYCNWILIRCVWYLHLSGTFILSINLSLIRKCFIYYTKQQFCSKLKFSYVPVQVPP